MAKTHKTHAKKTYDPLFHIVKREGVLWWQSWIIRASAVLLSLIVCGIIMCSITKANPFAIYSSMFDGVIGSEMRRWVFVENLVLLLGVALAVTPAFKMRFWNIGAEGQVLVGGLATYACMFYLGDTMPTWLLFATMIVASIVASIVWAVIPALFKAKWNTNETLFTLMMNYVAIQLVLFCINIWATSGSGVLDRLDAFALPQLFDNKYLLNVFVIALLTIFMFIYLKYSKHGYEVAVVGESENTARYVGINTKWVIVRTMILSGALCGVIGVLLVGGRDYSVNAETVGGRGFTAIMVSWLAKFNPLFMILTAGLIIFLECGSKQLVSEYWREGLNASLADVVTGIILFFIIGCEFFINYQIKFRSSKASSQKKELEENTIEEVTV